MDGLCVEVGYVPKEPSDRQFTDEGDVMTTRKQIAVAGGTYAYDNMLAGMQALIEEAQSLGGAVRYVYAGVYQPMREFYPWVAREPEVEAKADEKDGGDA